MRELERKRRQEETGPERCHGVLGRQCHVTQKKTREAKRRQTKEELVAERSRKGNWGDKSSQERRSGDER